MKQWDPTIEKLLECRSTDALALLDSLNSLDSLNTLESITCTDSLVSHAPFVPRNISQTNFVRYH